MCILQCLSSSQSTRELHCSPMAFNYGQNSYTVQARQGLGRGRGGLNTSNSQPRGRGAMFVNQESAVRTELKSVPGANQRAHELENAQRPYSEYEVSCNIYIPFCVKFCQTLEIIAEDVICT